MKLSFYDMPFGAHLGRRMRATAHDGEAWRLTQCETCGKAGLVVKRLNRRPIIAHALDGAGFTELHYLLEQHCDTRSLRPLLGKGSTLEPVIRNDVLGALRALRAVKHWNQAAVLAELKRLAPDVELSFPEPRTFGRIEEITQGHPAERITDP